MRRYKHSLSHDRLLTCDMGELVPVGCVEVLPGDTFDHQSSMLLRVSPLDTPVMHRVQARLHHFFVPNRLVWNVDGDDNWEKFITGSESGWTYPTISLSSPTESSLSTYLGAPPVNTLTVSALPIRAYNLIYNEYYRDQDLVTEVSQDTNTVQKVAWAKDYFTGARAWAQKGTAVTVPLGTEAPIFGKNMDFDAVDDSANRAQVLDGVGGNLRQLYGNASTYGYNSASGTGQLMVDLSNATGPDVVAFREAFAKHRYQEARARYGSRYVEYLRYCGIRPSDARLQRPEYLGGGKQTVAFSEVLQTGVDSTDAGVGTLRGHGIAALRTRSYRRFFEEHGHVLTLLSIRPKTVYMDACHKKWLRTTKEDYWQKELENIGAQAINELEVYAPGSSANTFGYADRYREYREEPSLVAGEFRSTLNTWHYARDLTSAPTLNQSFIECSPTKVPHADQSNDTCWIMVHHRLRARRLAKARAITSL